MNFYEALKERDIKYKNNLLDLQSDLALMIFETFKKDYVPNLIEDAIANNKFEVDILIGTNFDSKACDEKNQLLYLQFGEDCGFCCHADIYSYWLLGHYISKIPGIMAFNFDMHYMEFRIELKQLIDYYYEELQSEEYLINSR